MSASANYSAIPTEPRSASPESIGRLVPLLYEELRAIAHRQIARRPASGTLDSTGLVHEAIEQLRLLPYRPLAEPAIATLHAGAAAPATHWSFTSPEAEPRITRSV